MRTIYQSSPLIYCCFVEEWRRIRPEIIAALQLQEERTLKFERELGFLDRGFEFFPHCSSSDLNFEWEFGEWFNSLEDADLAALI